jgi:metacaspase-1
MNKALLVGINDYPGVYNDLMGCVNDVHNMQDLLVSFFGFASQDITILTDREATTSNILNGLNVLVSGANPGDLLIFHYSGHGSQVTDTNGDETDKLDEIICPYDLDRKSKMIKDDDLAKILAPLPPGVHVEIFLDSCHFGTGLKLMPGNNGGYRRARYLPPPKELVKPSLNTPVRVAAIRPAKAQILWAGCRANQYSSDALIDGKYGGAFTA